MEEHTKGAPLTASVGEQLTEKAHLEEERERERSAGRAVQHRVERKKVEEREAAERHAVLGRRPPPAAGGGHALWPVLLGGLAAFGAIYVLGRLVRRR